MSPVTDGCGMKLLKGSTHVQLSWNCLNLCVYKLKRNHLSMRRVQTLLCTKLVRLHLNVFHGTHYLAQGGYQKPDVVNIMRRAPFRGGEFDGR